MAELDRADFEILRLLQEDGLMSNAEIGKLVHLSASTVSRRIDALKEAGYIKGFRAVLDHQRLGLSAVIYTQVALRNHGNEDLEEFEGIITATMPHIVECMRACGNWDYLLKFVVRDTGHFGELLGKLTATPVVKWVRSYPIISSREFCPLPVG
jgi:Lrp/AsnC family leucine-responsive transcriptional regulator